MVSEHLGMLCWIRFLCWDILCVSVHIHTHSEFFLAITGKWLILASFLHSGAFPTTCGNGPWAFYVVWTIVGKCAIFIWFLTSGALNDTMWVFIAVTTLTFVFRNFIWIKKLPWFQGWSWWNGRTQGCVCVFCSEYWQVGRSSTLSQGADQC